MIREGGEAIQPVCPCVAERGKELLGSHWSVCRLSLNIFVFNLVPHALFQLCPRTQSSEAQLLKRYTSGLLPGWDGGSFLALWSGGGNLAPSFKYFQPIIPVGLASQPHPHPSLQKYPNVSISKPV